MIFAYGIYDKNRRVDLVQRGRPSQDSRRRSRGWEFGTSRLRTTLSIIYRHGMRETWAASSLSAPPLFRFLAWIQTAATPSHVWIYFSYDGRANAPLPYWRLRVEVLRANAYARTRGYRLTHYVVAITCIFRGSRIADSRVRTHNVNESARSVRLDVAHKFLIKEICYTERTILLKYLKIKIFC